MRRFHIAIGVRDIDASIADYATRLGSEPSLSVPGEYALWRTDVLNLSIRKVDAAEAGTLRHVGWEDPASEAFSSETDVNGIVWERFSAEQQLAEIRSIWQVAAPAESRRSQARARPTLLLIDVQNAIDHPSWGQRNNPDAEQRMADLLTEWRRRAWPIVHVRHLSREPASTYRPGQAGCEFKSEVMPQPGEKIVTKHTNSAFIGTDLEHWLRSMNVEMLVICGVITNNSVEATARMAGNLGYRTFVVSDATATFDRRDFAGRMRAADEVHAMSLANLHGEYARVISSAALMRALDLLAKPVIEESLDEVRAAIDRTDRAIISLLAERARYVARAAQFKKTQADVEAPARVEQVIAKVTALAHELELDPALVERVYRTLIAEFIAAERREHAAITPPRS